ncbi:IclR family transcriptional regulator [Mesorhizobium sp. WSM4887]|nr:IclR family transcriptional regulator [Mesorhizobium sp. WSM4887]MDG4886813.1 IclR family transcriptional regulator [Mesorhizobium sp. WSM4887]
MRKREKNPAASEGDDSQGVSGALMRGFQVLRAFTPNDSSLGNFELMERTGLPKATVSRLTYTLASLGYLVYNEVLGRYSLGSGVIALGYSALSSNPIIHLARPLMQRIADETGAAVALGTRDQAEMVYLSNCRSESLVTLRLNIGSRIPLWKSGMGLAYLVGLTPDERADLKERFGWAESGDRRKIDRILDEAMTEYAEYGYITAFGTWHSYVRAVGIPLRPLDGSPILSITCGGIAEIIDEESARNKIGPALVSMVSKIQADLGASIKALPGSA